MQMEVIHLDCAAGVPIRTELAGLYPALAQQYGLNPHGLTCYAEAGRRAILDAERRLLALCGTTSAEAGVVWCATGTEAANIALRGFSWKHPNDALALDAGAHPALTMTGEAFATSRPVHRFLVQEDGSVPPPPSPCGLVALSQVNNETGLMWNGDRSDFPGGTAVLLDACQAFGKHSLLWRSADMAILSSRKIGGPATGAALVYRKFLKLNDVITGGGQQPLRSGTLDTVSILLFVKAAELACAEWQWALERIAKLNLELRTEISRLSQGKCVIFSPESGSPYICYFAIPGYEGAIIARSLAEKYHILIGTGSACSAESRHTSPLLARLGVPEDLARGALRVSFSSHTTQEDLRQFLNALPQVLKDY